MDAKLIANDDATRAPGRSLRTREFWRIVRMIRPYKRKLIGGLALTFAFAALHTAGIGAAFPVFKMLLEEEGLHGWKTRALASERLHVELAPLTEADSTRLLKVKQDSPLRPLGIQAGDTLRHSAGLPIREWLKTIADAPDGAGAAASVQTHGQEREVSIPLRPVGSQFRLMRWAGSLLPENADRDKLKTLIWLLAVLVVTTLLANACRFLGEVMVAGAVLRTLMDLRDRLYERTLRLPLAYFATMQTADVVTRFVQDVQEIQRGLLTLFGKFVREPLRAVFLIGFALFLDWRITLTVSVIVPIALVLFWAVGRSVKKANKKLLEQYGHMISALTASLQNLRVVKVHTAELHEQRRLDQVDRRMFRQQLKLARLDAFLSPMMECIGVVGGSILTVWLASMVLHRSLSVSLFATLGATLAVLFDPIRKMTDVYVRIQRATAGSERIFQVLDAPIESTDRAGTVEVTALARDIRFEKVSFTYPRANTPALTEIDLTIQRGETLAIVGPNGCGKTTLVSMLPRLYLPDQGRVLYDGTDLANINLESLRQKISVVTQDAVIFAGTPLENIGYGLDQHDRGRMEDAARRAFADEFIRALPGGYDATLGERGTTLSGGQRQRLAIARAIYRDAPILIFDEATSQVDSESELKIQQALRDFARARTTIIIAHRLSTIQFATRIVVMEAGRIIDSGTHAELFARCALYRTLCQTQMVDDSQVH